MTNLNDAVRLLRAKREELLQHLKAIDTALEALSGLTVAGPPARGGTPETTADETEEADSVVLPTRLKARKTLSDEHKHALKEGRRKARHAVAVAAGFARELHEPPPGLPSGGGDPKPKLVRRTR